MARFLFMPLWNLLPVTPLKPNADQQWMVMRGPSRYLHSPEDGVSLSGNTMSPRH